MSELPAFIIIVIVGSGSRDPPNPTAAALLSKTFEKRKEKREKRILENTIELDTTAEQRKNRDSIIIIVRTDGRGKRRQHTARIGNW